MKKSPSEAVLSLRADKYLASMTTPTAQYAEFLTTAYANAVAIGPDGREDSWQNLLTGTGTVRDKVTQGTFSTDGQLSYGLLEDLYHNDDMSARIVDAAPDQMLREGFSIEAGDDHEIASDLLETCEALEVQDKFLEAFTWGRLYGGAAVLIGANDGVSDASKPLNEKALKSIDFLTVVDRFSIVPSKWYDDPTKPKFGEPEVYRVINIATPMGTGSSMAVLGREIHETRLITFRGARTTIRKRRANWGWDDSVLQRPYQVLQLFGMNWASVANLMSDASQAVYKMKGLLGMVTGGEKDGLLDRMAQLDMARSSSRMVMIDADTEDFSRVATPFSGIPDLLDKTAQRLAAAARMPLTVLMGVSPAGLNATGESDIRLWYDQVATMQRSQLAPRLKKLVRLLMLAKKIDLPEWDITFPPLWQMTAPEEASYRKTVAETDNIYITQGVVTAEEVALSRFKQDGFDAETHIDIDLREKLSEEDAQSKQLGGGDEPPPPAPPSGTPLPPKPPAEAK